MKLGIDARKYNDFGIGTYIRTLARFLDNHPEVEVTYFASPADAERIAGKHRGRTLENRSGKYSLRELFSVSAQANRAGLDLYHAPHYTLPVGLRMRSVVTIHDLIHLRFPGYFSALQRTYARMMLTHACRRSDAVIADSAFTAGEIENHLECPAGKINVIPLGVPEGFTPGDAAQFRATAAGAELAGAPFLLYVGNLKPHKNVSLLVRALGRITERGVHLVCVGGRIEDDATLRAACAEAGVGERVHSLGWIREEDLINAYRAASATVLPSLYEGFGYPVVESMACGTPVIGARAGSIPEVMGEAGVLIDPADEESLTYAITDVLRNTELRTTLRERGLERAKLFTSDRCAEQTLTLYRSLL